MSLNSRFLLDINTSTLTTEDLSRNLVRSLAEHSQSLSLCLSLRNGFPLLGFKQTLNELKTVHADDAAACVLPTFATIFSQAAGRDSQDLCCFSLEVVPSRW